MTVVSPSAPRTSHSLPSAPPSFGHAVMPATIWSSRFASDRSTEL